MSKTLRQRHPSIGRFVFEFLGSMNLAVLLLCMVAVASAIGTLLQQNQPYQDYLLRFGPFWFEVFESLGLYDVYGNVSEWVWKDEQEVPFTDVLSGQKRVSVGGSAGDVYTNLQYEEARSLDSTKIDEGTGFRLLRVLQ